MAKGSDYNDSHLSQGGAHKPTGPVAQHKRLAAGEKVDGKTNPHGAEPDRSKKVNSTY